MSSMTRGSARAMPARSCSPGSAIRFPRDAKSSRDRGGLPRIARAHWRLRLSPGQLTFPVRDVAGEDPEARDRHRGRDEEHHEPDGMAAEANEERAGGE